MSHRLIDRSPDLKRLRNEGYDIAILDGYLVVKDVPYLTSEKEIKRGVLVSKLTLANDITTKPDDHVAFFAGEYPCHRDGSSIERIRHSNAALKIGDITANLCFSAKPKPSGQYDDYYKKISSYADILSGPAETIDPNVTPKTYPVMRADEAESIFKYVDTASSRGELTEVTKKLELRRIAIVGLGGTGSYVLDLVSKTPVAEIHLFDGDIFLQHNAFRAPGAASGEELEQKLSKVVYFERVYSKMRRGIIPHPEYIDSDNLEQLEGMDFVFVCMEGSAKKLLIRKLEELNVPFIDVGMGVYQKNGALGGLLRTTTSVPAMRDHVWTKQRIPFSDASADNEYDKNIQIADLNALNAALAVIRWKKLFDFYADQEHEHFSTYAIGGNDISNEDQT
jgi:hypothetical protein